MSRRPTYVLAALLAALGACESERDASDASAGRGGQSRGGEGPGGASALGGSTGSSGSKGGSGGAGIRGGAAGNSAQGGDATSRGGATSGGVAALGGAGTSGGVAALGGAGTSGGAGAFGGTVSNGGTASNGGASNPSGGRPGAGGAAATGGSSGLGGKQGASGGGAGKGGVGGEAGRPSSACVAPIETVDVSRLAASETFEPYVVTGDTASAIRRSINQNRGADYDAYTGWYVSWKFGDCAGNGLVVTVTINYEYPRWEPAANASDTLSASWNAYTSALFCHEYGHAKNALDCANEVASTLGALRAGGDCRKQQAEAQAAFDAILDKCTELDVKYDADTKHGATMGATFPP